MKQDILKKLEKNKSISGEILAREFNVSRTAIWKNIQLLKKDSYL